MLTTILVAVLGFVVFFVVLFLFGHKDDSAGAHVMSVNCPDCGQPTPKFRKPTSFRQAILGGWTCESCGTELDRSGHRLDKAA